MTQRQVSVAAERIERWVAGFAERHGATATTTGPDVVELVGADGARAWIDVPYPPLTGDLVEHCLRDRRIGVLLVRRGGYAVGVFDGTKLLASKVGSSYVQGTTKAGGWSQQRQRALARADAGAEGPDALGPRDDERRDGAEGVERDASEDPGVPGHEGELRHQPSPVGGTSAARAGTRRAYGSRAG